MRNKFSIYFLIILCSAFVLRVWHVDQIPPSLSWDEVSIGYNAYSILKTGKDEHGRFLPLDTFAAYGDYKPPLSIYVTVPAVALFGLNEFSVRLPSVVFGTATVGVIFFLACELFGAKRRIPWIAMALMAINPWHIQLSRAGFEGNIAVFFIVSGALLLLLGRTSSTILYGACIPYVLAVYTFNSARYVAPLLAILIVCIFWKEFKDKKKQLGIGICLSCLMLMPIAGHLVSKEARLRFTEVNIFTDPSVVTKANDRILSEGSMLTSKIFDNRRIGYARSYLIHFFDNLEPDFLFVRGDGNPKFSTQDTGGMYLIDALMVAVGFLAIFSFHAKIGWLLFGWIILSIAPAAVARETPHALRTENALPAFLLLSSFGFDRVIEYIKTRNKRVILGSIICFVYATNVLYFTHSYFVHAPVEFSGEWQYGYREAIRVAQAHSNDLDTIVITESIGRAYMYTLFYTKSDPSDYISQKNSSFDASGFYHVYGFGKYRFVEQISQPLEPRTLYIGKPSEVPEGATVLDTIPLLNGIPVLSVFHI